MKIVLLLICVALAGCGAKSNEDKARDLIKEYLKTNLADYENYESVNFGTLGSALMPFEESDLYISNIKAINTYKDSIAILENLVKANATASASGDSFKTRELQLQDSIKAISERNQAAKQAYTPGKLFKISHGYKIKDESGVAKETEHEFYFDKDLTKVVKERKVF